MKFVFVCSLFLFFRLSAACIVQKELTEKMKASADAVFVGKAVEYQPPVIPGRPAILRFKVLKMIAGTPQKEFKVFWSNGTFGSPRSLAEFLKSYGAQTRLGIVLPESFSKKCNDAEKEGAASKTSPDHCQWLGRDPGILWSPVEGFPDLPWVLQGGCTPPYMDEWPLKPL